MNHRDTTLPAEELNAELVKVFELGAEGPGFCGAHYVGFATCSRMAGHDGEHVTAGLSGRLIGF